MPVPIGLVDADVRVVDALVGEPGAERAAEVVVAQPADHGGAWRRRGRRRRPG